MPELRRRLDVRAMLSDPEYAAPGELNRVVEAWPEKCRPAYRQSGEAHGVSGSDGTSRMMNAGSVQNGG